MNVISLRWLLNLVMGSERANRPHAANLDVVRSLFDAETNSLNWTFGVIAATAGTLAAAILGALLTVFNPSTSRTVATVDGNVTTTVFVEKSGDFGTSELVLSISLGLVIVTSIAALIMNRLFHVNLRRGRAAIVELYYFLHRMTP